MRVDRARRRCYLASMDRRGDITNADAETIRDLRREIDNMRVAAERRNRQLDALGVVWCDGGCDGGMHRYSPDREVTAQQVADLVVNAGRAVDWFVSHAGRVHDRACDRRTAWDEALAELQAATPEAFRVMVDRAASRAPRPERTNVDAPLHQRLLEHSRVLGPEQDDDLRRDSLPPHLRPVFDDLLLASQALAGHDVQVSAFREHAERTQEWIKKMSVRDREQQTASPRLEAVAAGKVSPGERVFLDHCISELSNSDARGLTYAPETWRRYPNGDDDSACDALCFASATDSRTWLRPDETCFRVTMREDETCFRIMQGTKRRLDPEEALPLETTTAGEVQLNERVRLHGRLWRREPAYDLVSRFPAANIVHLCFADDGDRRERVWMQPDKTCYRIPATEARAPTAFERQVEREVQHVEDYARSIKPCDACGGSGIRARGACSECGGTGIVSADKAVPHGT